MTNISAVDWISAEMASPLQRHAFFKFIEKYAEAKYEIKYCSVLSPSGSLVATALVYRVNDDSGIGKNKENGGVSDS